MAPMKTTTPERWHWSCFCTNTSVTIVVCCCSSCFVSLPLWTNNHWKCMDVFHHNNSTANQRNQQKSNLWCLFLSKKSHDEMSVWSKAKMNRRSEWICSWKKSKNNNGWIGRAQQWCWCCWMEADMTGLSMNKKTETSWCELFMNRQSCWWHRNCTKQTVNFHFADETENDKHLCDSVESKTKAQKCGEWMKSGAMKRQMNEIMNQGHGCFICCAFVVHIFILFMWFDWLWLFRCVVVIDGQTENNVPVCSVDSFNGSMPLNKWWCHIHISVEFLAHSTTKKHQL